jgi:2-oxoglutarate/2-oxoacid ferredoxin oxidoreductase subunit alpha
VSAFGIPGDSRNLVVTDSDEHDEEGHIIEDAETRVKMVQKRLIKKLPLIKQEIVPPLLYGSNNPDIILVCWGSLYGVIREAVNVLSKEKKVAMLHFSEVYPFPFVDRFDYLALLNDTKISVCIEQNATGQFSRLFRSETGYKFTYTINKYDGRPFMVEELLREVYDDIRGL